MPLYDYECKRCGLVHEAFVKSGIDTQECPQCGHDAKKIYLVLAKPAWLALAQGDSASPEAIERFDRMHRQQKAKEEKSQRDHGDDGRMPGS